MSRLSFLSPLKSEAIPGQNLLSVEYSLSN